MRFLGSGTRVGRCVRVVRFRVFSGGVGGLDEFWLRLFVGCAMGVSLRDALGFPTPSKSVHRKFI